MLNLYYPFVQMPREGELIEVAPSLFWLRIDMPFALNHINIWLFEDDDSWTIVDTGLASETNRILWQFVIAKHLKGKPIKQVICTHMHPDHIGLAGWLCRLNQGELWMSAGEYDSYSTLLREIRQEDFSAAVQFYHTAGVSDKKLSHYTAFISFFEKSVSRLPDTFGLLSDGARLNLGGQEWRVVVGRGHSREHVCLLCERLGIFISGDQLLPGISSNVSVWPKSPEGNPLEEWLASCCHLNEILDDEHLVLPSHGMPFKKARLRISELIGNGERGLETLTEYCETPRRVVDAFPILFKPKVNRDNLMMACGESRAHFNCLRARQKLVAEIDKNGVMWFGRIA